MMSDVEGDAHDASPKTLNSNTPATLVEVPGSDLRLVGVNGSVMIGGHKVVVPRDVQSIPAETLHMLHTSSG
jgi:hypothetical protein